MTTPELVPLRTRYLLLEEEEAQVQATLDMLKHENQWIKGLIFRLAAAIKNIGK